MGKCRIGEREMSAGVLAAVASKMRWRIGLRGCRRARDGVRESREKRVGANNALNMGLLWSKLMELKWVMNFSLE
jgi:hypothetical protein